MVPWISCCEPGIQTPTANVKSLFMPEIVVDHRETEPGRFEKHGKPWKGLGLGGVYIQNDDFTRKIVIL
jgi:hypothetical protein